MTQNTRRIIEKIVLGCLLINIVGCKKLVEVDTPLTGISASVVFSSDATAAAVLTGIYANLTASPLQNGNHATTLSFFGGLSADEFTLHTGISGSQLFYYSNSLNGITIGNGYWESLYPKIFIVNSAIEGLSTATSLTPSVKAQLLGEAKFLRAFFYFYLVNLYGDVPLVLTTDYIVNSTMPRTPKAEVWAQIIKDLNDAQSLLSSNYMEADIYSTTSERVRPTKWAAAALLSRVNLYDKKWNEAETAATTVISNTTSFDTVSLNNAVFGKESKEAIWQLQPVKSGFNTWDAWLFIIPATGPSPNYPVYLSPSLMNSFEPGDNRKAKWVNSVTVSGTFYYFPFKYTSASLNAPVTEYPMVLRLGEVYLNRAEARAQQNNLAGAIADLDVIRKRAGLPLIANTNPGISQSALIDKILNERQVELFTEWGHRWFDLKRTGTVDAVMSIVTPQKGGTWNTNWQWYPISQSTLQGNPFLVQNAGYQ